MFLLTRKFLAGVLAVFCALYAALPVSADLSDQLNSSQQREQEAKNKKEQAQEQVDSFSESLRKIQTEKIAAETRYKELKAQRDNKETEIKANTEILAKAEKDLAHRNGILSKRMRDIYENGQVNYLEVLFGASDFNDFANRMNLLKRVAQQDIDLVNEVKATRQLIIVKRTELVNDRTAILNLENQAQAQKDIAESKRKEEQAKMYLALYNRDAAEKAEREAQADSQQIMQMIRQYQSNSSYGGSVKGTGALQWPIRGEITSPFGGRIHPIFGTYIGHTGIDIAADYNDPVRAADGGIVISAGWYGGYGNAVIIDHGNGMTTLYGHNTSLAVSEGQRVSKGQVISYAGSTGNSTGPHVHFEVRQNGTPVNPLNFL
ncbi:MAG: peptidoglycan DD-metalloendopeptidase family protein [Pelosinus sp.]|nr:peptidoglycan DD-metalloendopeptidase family protein [Pelosinus sp.]